MDEMSKYSSYGEYKQILDSELQKTAEGFVKIGYLLKQARDTNILEEPGYKNYIDFAQAEYGIDKTTVSRFIRINDKFSEEGNSDQLQEQYRGYGYAKLAIMLQLPDEVNNIITPDFSKSEINALKDEVDAEGKVSDLEVMMEQEPMMTRFEETSLDKALMKLLHDDPQLYIELHDGFQEGQTEEERIKMIANIIAPAETKVDTVRIPGIGRLMISIKGRERDIEVVNVRSGEKETFSWEKMLYIVSHMCAMGVPDGKEAWQRLYMERFPEEEPKKVEVAPVQQKKQEPKKQSKVTKAKVEKPKEEKTEKLGQPEEIETRQEENEISQDEENAENGTPKSLHDIDPEIPAPEPLEPESEENGFNDEESEESEEDGTMNEQIPGQDTVENHKEWMPENNPDIIDADFQEVGTKSEENETQIDENEHFESENGTISANSDNNSAETDTKLIFEEETQTDEERPQMMDMIELIQQEIDKLRDNVDAERWEQALMDLENIQFKINKAKDMEEMEEDE